MAAMNRRDHHDEFLNLVCIGRNSDFGRLLKVGNWRTGSQIGGMEVKSRMRMSVSRPAWISKRSCVDIHDEGIVDRRVLTQKVVSKSLKVEEEKIKYIGVAETRVSENMT